MPTVNPLQRGRVRRAAAVLIGCSALVATIPIHASTPDHPDVWAPADPGRPGGAFSSAGWTGPSLAGSPDPLGPPAATCNSGSPVSNGCDRTPFTVHGSAAFVAGNAISVTVAVQDSDASTSFDLAIVDTNNVPIVQTIAASTTATVTAPDLLPGSYQVEVDGDIGDPADTGYTATLTLASHARTAQPSHPSGGITAGRETVADPFRLGTEPTIAVSKDGTVYTGPIFGSASTQSFIQRSDNDGVTFNTLGVPGVGKINGCEGGGDEDMATDNNNNLYFIDLGTSPVVPASVSPDHGNTFAFNCLANDTDVSKPNNFPDRQWLSTDLIHNVEWYIYRDGLIGVNSPTDPVAGSAFGEFIKSAPLAGGAAGPAQLLFTDLCKSSTPPNLGVPCVTDVNVAGNAVTDNSPTSAFKGNTYLALRRTVTIGTTNHPAISVVVINPTSATPVVERTAVLNADAVLFPTVAVDAAGTIYETYTDSSTFQLMFTRSMDAGVTWTAPIVINGAPAAVTAMPWIIAGDRGRIDVVFYASSSTLPDTANYGPWNVYMLQDLKAAGATPAFSDWTQSLMTDRGNHVAPVCLSGLACALITGAGGDRELGDFFRIGLDGSGRALVSFADGNNQLGQEVAGGPSPAPSFADFLRQATGPSLFGTGSVPPIQIPTNSVAVGAHSDPIPFAAPACNPPTGPCPSSDALNLLGSSASVGTGPDGTDVHIHLTVKTLSQPLDTGADTAPALANSTFLTRWWFGGKIWFVAAEVTGGQFRFFSGQAAPVSDALSIKYSYYPATGAAAGTVTPSNGSTPGAIDLYVAPALVGGPTAADVLYSVTSYSTTHASPTASTPPTASNFTDLPQIADVLPAYNVVPFSTSIPELPWTPALIAVGVAAIAFGLIRRRGRREAAP